MFENVKIYIGERMKKTSQGDSTVQDILCNFKSRSN